MISFPSLLKIAFHLSLKLQFPENPSEYPFGIYLTSLMCGTVYTSYRIASYRNVCHWIEYIKSQEAIDDNLVNAHTHTRTHTDTSSASLYCPVTCTALSSALWRLQLLYEALSDHHLIEGFVCTLIPNKQNIFFTIFVIILFYRCKHYRRNAKFRLHHNWNQAGRLYRIGRSVRTIWPKARCWTKDSVL